MSDMRRKQRKRERIYEKNRKQGKRESIYEKNRKRESIGIRGGKRGEDAAITRR